MENDFKPVQASFLNHRWKSPDGKTNYSFSKLELSCEPDKYPGVVIISYNNHSKVNIYAVKNLAKELPSLLEKDKSALAVYWRLEDDSENRKRILKGLTNSPSFLG